MTGGTPSPARRRPRGLVVPLAVIATVALAGVGLNDLVGPGTPAGAAHAPLSTAARSAPARPPEPASTTVPHLPTQLVEEPFPEAAPTPTTPGTASPGSTNPGSTSPGSTSPGSTAVPDLSALHLPPPEPAGGRPVTVVLSPHPDDETLSLAVWIEHAVAHGHRVVLVALTDGRSTGAVTRLDARLGRPLRRDEIAAGRLLEFAAAAHHLGVAPGDVVRAGLDADAGPGGTRVTPAEALAVIRVLAQRFPGADFATMSWVAEQHPDHLAAGQALWQARQEGVVTSAIFAVSRLWWAMPSPPTGDEVPSGPVERERLRAAAAAYDRWDPAHGLFAIGHTSVPSQFAALLADPRSRLHGWQPPAD